MTSHFVFRSTTLAAAFLLFATGAANAACLIDEASVSPATDEVLPTMADTGQWSSFVATGDCGPLIFSVEETALIKIPTGGWGPSTDPTYRVFLTEASGIPWSTRAQRPSRGRSLHTFPATVSRRR